MKLGEEEDEDEVITRLWFWWGHALDDGRQTRRRRSAPMAQSQADHQWLQPLSRDQKAVSWRAHRRCPHRSGCGDKQTSVHEVQASPRNAWSRNEAQTLFIKHQQKKPWTVSYCQQLCRLCRLVGTLDRAKQLNRKKSAFWKGFHKPSSLMKTEAVMCIALTKQSPSFTPLSRTHSSTWRVMFTNAILSGISNSSTLR